MTTPGTHLARSPRKPVQLRHNKRRVLAVILGLTGVAMSLVVMSDPRVSMQIRNGVDTVSAPFVGSKVAFADHETARFMGELAPSLPTSVGKIRVRRANVLTEN